MVCLWCILTFPFKCSCLKNGCMTLIEHDAVVNLMFTRGGADLSAETHNMVV